MNASLAELTTPANYQAERTHVFPTPHALQWFIRQNKGQLIEGGALVAPAGRKMICGSAFDRVVLDVGAKRVREL